MTCDGGGNWVVVVVVDVAVVVVVVVVPAAAAVAAAMTGAAVEETRLSCCNQHSDAVWAVKEMRNLRHPVPPLATSCTHANDVRCWRVACSTIALDPNQTPLAVARAGGHDKVVFFLMANGATS